MESLVNSFLTFTYVSAKGKINGNFVRKSDTLVGS